MTKEKTLESMARDRERNRKIRAVVSDMDGSFLDGRGMASQRNIEAVHALVGAGLRFMVCTGRSYDEARIPLKEAGISCDMIAMNGAAIYDSGGRAVKEHILSRDKVDRMIQAVEPFRDRLIVQLVTSEGDYIIAREDLFRHFFAARIFPHKERSREEEEALFAVYHRVTKEEFLGKELRCFKAVTLSEDTQLIGSIRDRLTAVGGVCVAASFPTNWEITHEQASKGAGLTDCAKRMGYGLHEIMALGDGDNDKTMLSLPLGWSVAMGNAGEALKEAAQIITGANTEDGFAQAVEALLEGRR